MELLHRVARSRAGTDHAPGYLGRSVTTRSSSRSNSHRTTLIFVNTRRLVERVSHQLSERLGEDKVGAHHGSLSRKTRLEVEEKLKSGAYAGGCCNRFPRARHRHRPCRCGVPYRFARAIWRVLLQRVGRSGHWLGAIPKGRVLSADARRSDAMRGRDSRGSAGRSWTGCPLSKSRSISWRSRWSRRVG